MEGEGAKVLVWVVSSGELIGRDSLPGAPVAVTSAHDQLFERGKA